MRIRSFFLAAISAVGVIASVAAMAIVGMQWHLYRDGSEAAQLSRAAGAVLRLVEKAVIERGNYVSRFNAPAAADQLIDAVAPSIPVGAFSHGRARNHCVRHFQFAEIQYATKQL